MDGVQAGLAAGLARAAVGRRAGARELGRCFLGRVSDHVVGLAAAAREGVQEACKHKPPGSRVYGQVFWGSCSRLWRWLKEPADPSRKGVGFMEIMGRKYT